MAQLLNILFKKNDPYTSWGFQVCGGRDSWRPLTVRHVQNETLAANYLNVGDRVLEIDGIDCYSLTESQAIAFLRRPSTCIEILILKRRGENVVPPKRSSSCRALQYFSFQNIKNQQHSISEPCSPPENHENPHEPHSNDHLDTRCFSNSNDETLKSTNREDASVQQKSQPLPQAQKTLTDFSNFRPRRNSYQKDSEQIRLRSRSNSPQFWKVHTDASPTIASSSDCRKFWKNLEKSSMEDLSVRHTPSPVRPASVAFYPNTPEPVSSSPVKYDVSPKKKVTFSNVLLERNYLQMDLPDLSPGSKVDEEFNKIYNSAKQEDQHQVGATKSLGNMSAPPPPPPMPHFSGGTVQGGGPPPPPPMLHNGHIPAIRIKTELNEQPRELPSAIQNAMATKDKKPFSYLPGGLNLSEIKSPRMQRRLERNAQTPPSPDQTPQKSPEYHHEPPQQQNHPIQSQHHQVNPQQYHLPQPPPPPPPHQQHNFNTTYEPKPMCNVRPAAERVCLLPQVQQPHLNKAPTPWLQKNVQPQQVQSFAAPWAQNRKDNVDQVDRPLQERVIPLRVEPVRQPPSSQPQLQSPLKNTSMSYDSEPIQGRSFKVLQQITQEPKGIYDGTQPYNSQALPLSELRKMNLSDDDRSFMNRVKTQVTNGVHQSPGTHYISVEPPVESKIYVPPSERPTGLEPHKYTGGSIPSRSFRMLQAMTGQNNGHLELGESDF